MVNQVPTDSERIGCEGLLSQPRKDNRGMETRDDSRRTASHLDWLWESTEHTLHAALRSLDGASQWCGPVSRETQSMRSIRSGCETLNGAQPHKNTGLLSRGFH